MANTCVLQTVDTVPFYGLSANNQRIIDAARIALLSVIVCTIEAFFRTAFGWVLDIQRRAHTCRRLACFAYLCDDAGRTSPRAGRRAGSPRVWSRQAGTLAEEANEKTRLESRKGSRSTESARIPLLQRHDFGFDTYIYKRFPFGTWLT